MNIFIIYEFKLYISLLFFFKDDPHIYLVFCGPINYSVKFILTFIQYWTPVTYSSKF